MKSTIKNYTKKRMKKKLFLISDINFPIHFRQIHIQCFGDKKKNYSKLTACFLIGEVNQKQTKNENKKKNWCYVTKRKLIHSQLR